MMNKDIKRFKKLAGLITESEDTVRFGNEEHDPHREEQEYCESCGWSWSIEDGGEDPHTCHKCQHTNETHTDHEVSMAQASLEQIRKSAEELMAKLGEHEADIPAWIQDHIAKAQNYIEQANDNFYFNDEN